MERKVTLSRVRGWDASFVEVNRIKRGIIRPENGSWVAERMGCYKTQDTNNRHGIFSTKQEAVDAIVKASEGQPKYIVYPARDENRPLNWESLGIAAR